MKLAVGLRGIALYDRVLLGRVTMPSNLNGNGLSATITTSRPEQELFGYFQSPQPALPAPAN